MRTYQIKASANNPNTTEVIIYGDIGAYDYWTDTYSNDAKTILAQIEKIITPNIDVRLNSFGGSVVEAMAIFNGLKRHPAAITCYIDGVAMSAAADIVMAGDSIVMAANGLLMLHGSSTLAAGNAAYHRATADMLEKYNEARASNYVAKSGKSLDEITAILNAGIDYFYTAQEALDMGFIDQIGEESNNITASAAQITARYTLPTAWLSAAQTKPEPKPKSPTGKTTMTDKTKTDQQSDAEKPQEPTAHEKETQRQAGIKGLFDLVPVARQDIHAIQPMLMIDNAIDVEAARKQILAKMGEDSQPVATGNAYIEMGASASDKFRVGATAALQIKSGVTKPDANFGANEFKGLSLLELSGHVLAMHGINYRNMDKMQRVAAAFTHSSGDFIYILQNTANKAMLMGWDESPETYQNWTRKGNLSDFKVASRVGLDTMPSLLEIPEGAEYQSGTTSDRKENIQLATYGRKFSITRQAIINDDLDVFSKIPLGMGRAARRTVGNLVYAVLTGNPAMSDAKALFHADHSNIAGAAAVPTTTSVSAMRTLMALQKDAAGNAAGLNIQLAYILCPIALQDQVNTVLTSAVRVDAVTESKSTAPNSVRGLFQVVSDPRLDAASSQIWYGAANPNMHDTIEVGYLDGNDMPFMEQQAGWDVDGVEYKVRIDATAKALDWRGLAKNAGA